MSKRRKNFKELYENEFYPTGELYCEYYAKEYGSGPPIAYAKIDEKYVTEKIITLYGNDHNWCGKLYTIKALGFEEDEKDKYIGKTLHIEYTIPRNWTKIKIKSINTCINPASSTPFLHMIEYD